MRWKRVVERQRMEYLKKSVAQYMKALEMSRKWKNNIDKSKNNKSKREMESCNAHDYGRDSTELSVSTPRTVPDLSEQPQSTNIDKSLDTESVLHNHRTDAECKREPEDSENDSMRKSLESSDHHHGYDGLKEDSVSQDIKNNNRWKHAITSERRRYTKNQVINYLSKSDKEEVGKKEDAGVLSKIGDDDSVECTDANKDTSSGTSHSDGGTSAEVVQTKEKIQSHKDLKSDISLKRMEARDQEKPKESKGQATGKYQSGDGRVGSDASDDINANDLGVNDDQHDDTAVREINPDDSQSEQPTDEKEKNLHNGMQEVNASEASEFESVGNNTEQSVDESKWETPAERATYKKHPKISTKETMQNSSRQRHTSAEPVKIEKSNEKLVRAERVQTTSAGSGDGFHQDTTSRRRPHTCDPLIGMERIVLESSVTRPRSGDGRLLSVHCTRELCHSTIYSP